MSNPTARAVGPAENFVTVVEWLLKDWGAHTIAEIERGTGLNRGQVRGALSTAVAVGWIEQRDTTYILADRVGLIGDRYRRQLFDEQLALQKRVERMGEAGLDFLTRSDK